MGYRGILGGLFPGLGEGTEKFGGSWDALALGRIWGIPGNAMGELKGFSKAGKVLGKAGGCPGTGNDLGKLGMTEVSPDPGLLGQSRGAQEPPGLEDFGIWDAQTKRSPSGLGNYKKMKISLFKVFITSNY